PSGTAAVTTSRSTLTGTASPNCGFVTGPRQRPRPGSSATATTMPACWPKWSTRPDGLCGSPTTISHGSSGGPTETDTGTTTSTTTPAAASPTTAPASTSAARSPTTPTTESPGSPTLSATAPFTSSTPGATSSRRPTRSDTPRPANGTSTTG